ncbi:somatomedin-B and thrombospondin type-1 domain-containing protein-like [Mercenaria mercenaria]|uniref:somatomedin-B and thrombospondin type-1 domain-containing protein-like n=1 Tax=Mercenaria mercenaria TaxID=6596 RepID=UPI00234F09AA|nr:somatomedin-B and thrombospondin type-1 domain-containing protein-like [Mercenaria mercenaria]
MYSSIALFAFILPYSLATLCAERKSCCRNDFPHELCVAKDEQHCHCDVACQRYGDCCEDYKQFCVQSPPEPCIYKQWEAWGPCSNNGICDIGYQLRSREVLQMGNFKSKTTCNMTDLVESRQCGDPSCYNYRMTKVFNTAQFQRDHFHFSTAKYRYVRGNCNQFGLGSYVCVMCPDNSRCGQNVLKTGENVTVHLRKCTGTFLKLTESAYRTQCSTTTPSVQIYAFEMDPKKSISG